jgi:hypothetical protein
LTVVHVKTIYLLQRERVSLVEEHNIVMREQQKSIRALGYNSGFKPFSFLVTRHFPYSQVFKEGLRLEREDRIYLFIKLVKYFFIIHVMPKSIELQKCFSSVSWFVSIKILLRYWTIRSALQIKMGISYKIIPKLSCVCLWLHAQTKTTHINICMCTITCKI